MQRSLMAAAAVLLVTAAPAVAQTAPQSAPEQSMPSQPAPAQTMPSQPGTEAAPMTSLDAGTAMSDADKRKMASCMKKSQEAIAKDSKCAALMQAHPEMMSNPG